MKIVVDVVPAQGSPQHWEMAPMYDGSDHPVTGNPDADRISIKRISDTKGESTFKKTGKVVAVAVRTLSPDGKTITIETKGTTADGKPRHDIAVFEKSDLSGTAHVGAAIDKPRTACRSMMVRSSPDDLISSANAVRYTAAAAC